MSILGGDERSVRCMRWLSGVAGWPVTFHVHSVQDLNNNSFPTQYQDPI